MPDEGGDPACWLDQVCDRCGAFMEAGVVHRCAVVTPLDDLPTDGRPDGAVWALAGERELDVNLVVLGPGGRIEAHANHLVDVLVVVLDGSGELTVDRVRQPLARHGLVLVPKGSVRALAAGPDGIRYLSVHRLRAPLGVRGHLPEHD